MLKLFKFFAFLIICIINCHPGLAKELSEELFFVGEDVKVLTIASRRPETPENAPAIASVITSEEIKKQGIKTLSEALSYVPGFFLLPQEWETLPFLRGIPNGILFLYDGIPLTSDSTKNLHPLDEELSLDAISRIEIVRGPGSVLWGPDAFAGIVNIVPKKGKQLEGIEAGISIGSPYKAQKFYLNLGKTHYLWQLFSSLYVYSYQPEPEYYSFSRRTGQIGKAEFYEAVLSLKYADWFKLSSRLSSFRRPFIIKEINGLSWPGIRQAPINFVKLELSKNFQHTRLSIKSFYSYLYQKHQELDIGTTQKNHLFYGELVLDREIFSARGLVTLGLSWRKNYVRDATINIRGFLPEYLSAEDNQFSPILDLANFNTRLFSSFFQYRHHLSKKLDFWFGLRFDDHNQYQSNLSYNTGFKWNISPFLQLKFIHGTAYRTPYSNQFLRQQNVNPEKIRNFSLEFSGQPRKNFSFSFVSFYNRIFHHIGEDPYGGFSNPTQESFLGFEGEVFLKISPSFSLKANFTRFSLWGDKENYRVLEYFIITPEGKRKEVYSYYQKPFPYGAKSLANFIFHWKPHSSWEINLRLYYIGHREFFLLKEKKFYAFPSYISGDLSLRYRFKNRSEIEFSLKNFLNQQALNPGTLAPIKNHSFTTFLSFRCFW